MDHLQAFQAFLRDNRHLAYEETSENCARLIEWAFDHDLNFTSEAFHLAFVELGDQLQLATFGSADVPEEFISESAASESSPIVPQSVSRPSRRVPTVWRNGREIPYADPVRL